MSDQRTKYDYILREVLLFNFIEINR